MENKDAADTDGPGLATGEAEDSEEDFKIVEFRERLKKGLKENLRWEHVIILLLIACIVFTLGDRGNLINECNNYWIGEIEKCYNTYDPAFQATHPIFTNVAPLGSYVRINRTK